MAHPLDGCRAKLDRAFEHIKQINDDIIVHRKIYISQDSVRATSEFKAGRLDDPSTYERAIIFYLSGNPPSVPTSFTILAGEAIHQLRSVLDHLVYQLVIEKTKQPPTFNSAFPIVGRGRKVNNVWRVAADEYGAQTNRLKQDISNTAEAEIHRLQPYHRGATFHEDPLWLLSELDNAYKHRLLLMTVHRVSAYTAIVTSRGQRIDASFLPNIRFEDGVELGRVAIADRSFSMANADVSVDGTLAISVAFDHVAGGTTTSVLDVLERLRRHVSAIVEGFMKEFS